MEHLKVRNTQCAAELTLAILSHWHFLHTHSSLITRELAQSTHTKIQVGHHEEGNQMC